MRDLLFAHAVLCALSVSAHAPWRWQLIPVDAHLVLEGREQAPGSWTARAHTDPGTAGSLELLLTSTPSAEARFSIRFTAAVVDGKAFCEAEMILNSVTRPLLLNVVVARSGDVNGQQLLHLSISEIPLRQGERSARGPRSGPVLHGSPFVLDAWFMLSDPQPAFVRFCNADD